MKDLKAKKAIKTLAELGYNVRLNKVTTKKTFEVEIDTLDAFMKIIEARNLKVKDAVQEALSEWIERTNRE